MLAAPSHPQGHVHILQRVLLKEFCIRHLWWRAAISLRASGWRDPGLPPVGTLFAVAINSFLVALRRATGGRHHFAFADDIASILKHMRDLEKILELFATFASISGLHIKPKKCFIIPLACDWSDEFVVEIREFLKRCKIKGIRPDHFQIANYCRYLGFCVGPGATLAVNWQAPLEKIQERERGRAIASAGVAPSSGVVLYGVKAFTTLGYVAHLCAPTAAALTVEKKAIQKVLHVTNNGIPKGSAHKLGEAGCLPFPSLEILTEAAQTRVMLCRFEIWPPLLELLQAARRSNEDGPISNTCPNLPLRDNGRWEAPAFVDTLEKARSRNRLGDFGLIQAFAKEAADSNKSVQKILSKALVPVLFSFVACGHAASFCGPLDWGCRCCLRRRTSVSYE